ncbi:MAG: rRNA adenine N-6-methyltransferase family protein [Patescibacteria group bacterium]
MLKSLRDLTKDFIKKYGIIPNEVRFGQHFLVDGKTVERFIEACEIKKEDKILEIGPGLGALSAKLARKSDFVTLVEIDKQFSDSLLAIQKKYPQLTIEFENALELPFYDFDLVCGALSYSIFEPLMFKLAFDNGFKKGVFIVSNKFAEDFANNKTRLTVLVDTFFEVAILERLPSSYFLPEPRTPGVIIKLERKDKTDNNHLLWKELFLQRDKKIKNALRESLINVAATKGKVLTKKEATSMFSKFENKDILEKTLSQLSSKDFVIFRSQPLLASPNRGGAGGVISN